MKRLLKWLIILLFLSGFVLGYLVVDNIEDHALVAKKPALNSQQLRKIRRLVNRNNPVLQSARDIDDKQGVVSRLNEAELNLLVNYILVTRKHTLTRRMASAIRIHNGEARLQITLELPENPIAEYFNPGRYINLSMKIKSQQNIGVVRLSDLQAADLQYGALKIPDGLTRMVMARAHDKILMTSPEYAELVESIQSVKFLPQQFEIVYQLQNNNASSMQARLGSMVIPAELKKALLVYSELLAEYSKTLPDRVELNQLLRGMFFIAFNQDDEISPVLENQAILITMAAYAMNRNIPRLLGETTATVAQAKRIYLKGRQDLSRHFLISAAITCLSDSELASMIGLEKEIYDAQGASGFSYADLAADHAGIQLAIQAMESDLDALKLQKFLAYSESENNFMPDISQLPEGIGMNAATSDMSDTSSEAYRTTTQSILQRIKHLPVYNQE